MFPEAPQRSDLAVVKLNLRVQLFGCHTTLLFTSIIGISATRYTNGLPFTPVPPLLTRAPSFTRELKLRRFAAVLPSTIGKQSCSKLLLGRVAKNVRMSSAILSVVFSAFLFFSSATVCPRVLVSVGMSKSR